jgi:hypothetical protein
MMVTEDKLAELRLKFETTGTIVASEFHEVLDTSAALWKVVHAAQNLLERPKAAYAPNSKKGELQKALKEVYR